MANRDDAALRAAARAWLAAADKLDAATAKDDDYGTALELAEAVTLARLGLQQALTEMGWSPPRSVRESQGS